MRALISPIVMHLAHLLFDPASANIEVMTLFFNFAHTILAGLLIVVIATLVILKILKEKQILYCTIPSIVFLGFSYVDIIPNFVSIISNTPAYSYLFVLLNPMLFLLMFALVFIGFRKLIAPNTTPQEIGDTENLRT